MNCSLVNNNHVQIKLFPIQMHLHHGDQGLRSEVGQRRNLSRGRGPNNTADAVQLSGTGRGLKTIGQHIP